MSIKKSETEIREDIKQMEEEIKDLEKAIQQVLEDVTADIPIGNEIAIYNESIKILKAKIEYAKSCID